MTRRVLLGLLGTAWLAAGCGLGSGPDPQAAEQLLDRAFVATAVEQAGEERPLVDGPLEVSFHEPAGAVSQPEDGAVTVGWTSGCNSYGLLVEVTGDRLEQHPEAPDGPEGTLIGCEPAMIEQETWLTEFFTDSPRWRLDGDALHLSDDDVEIDLEERS